MSDKNEPAMTTLKMHSKKRIGRESGQTLIIAIIILGILLILGFAFAGIISRNINEASRGQKQNLASDLARAGADYAHYQLRYSELGADWRPSPTPPDADAAGFTKDPDALYLRPADAFPFSNEARLANIVDLGGPDGYGPYTRIFYDRGRALVRVRFSPSTYEAFANPNGQIREPGKVRDYIVIEVIGRPGALRTGTRLDPSLQLPERVRVFNFANITEKTSEISRLKSLNNTLVNSRRLLAYASIGIIEHLRYITDKGKVSRPAELGFPNSTLAGNNRPSPMDQANTGASYGDGQAPYNGINDIRPVQGQMLWGRKFPEPNRGSANSWQTITGLGSLYSNCGLKIYGTHLVNLNSTFGESWDVAGNLSSANSQSVVNLTRTYYDRPNDLWRSNVNVGGIAFPSTVTNPVILADNQPAPIFPIDSGQPQFATVQGAFRDGFVNADSDGFSRGIPRKEPPSLQAIDPQNRQDRFMFLTRESGRPIGNRNTGYFGLGRGTYVDSPERGNTNSEEERAIAGAVKALPNDWLNPNNAGSQGWKGPYYIPIATYLRLLPDGYEIIRDTRSRNPFWINQNAQQTNQTRARFRIRLVEYPFGSGKFQTMVLNSIVNPTEVGKPGLTLTDDEFRQLGQLFNGVILCEGDVRVRGVIPTDQQLTVVSHGSIYIEGSVTKGVVLENGNILNRPSKSAIMLAARDHVVINTSMFFGPAAGESIEEKNGNSVPDTPNPFELKLDDPTVTLQAQFLLDPNTPATLGGDPNNPSTWKPYANNYVSFGTTNSISTSMLISSSADDNGPTFVSLDVAPGSYSLIGGWGTYLFPRDLTFGVLPSVRFNAAAQYFLVAGPIPVYGLGNPTLNAYPKFETIEFPIVTRDFNVVNRRLVPTNGNLGSYGVAIDDPTYVRVRMNGVGNVPMKNYLASKTAIAPFDIRIEAAMFAEDGSFYVIPGNWFNTTSQDSRRNWMDRTAGSTYAGMSDDEANQRRFELFGNTPSVPFYGEPLDVKISVFGSISENLPAPISAQAEWLKKWGWIPRQIGSSGLRIPTSHTSGLDPNVNPTLPNLTMAYDPVLASASVFDPSSNSMIPVRTNENGWVLPPMPRLPVSPTLAYFGEVNP